MKSTKIIPTNNDGSAVFFTFQFNVYKKKILFNSFSFGLGRHGTDCATDQYVVGLDVGVEDAVPLEVLQGQEQLLTVGTYSLHVQADVLPVFLQHLSQIHATRHNMSLLIKCHTQIIFQVN